MNGIEEPVIRRQRKKEGILHPSSAFRGCQLSGREIEMVGLNASFIAGGEGGDKHQRIGGIHARSRGHQGKTEQDAGKE